VEVEHHDVGLVAQLGEQLIGQRNGSSMGGMKTRPCRFSTATRTPHFDHRPPAARVARRVVRRPQQPRLAVEQRADLLLVPDVVAGGDHVHPELQELPHDLRRDPEAARRVLAVQHHHVRLFSVRTRRSSPLATLRPGLPMTSAMKRMRRAGFGIRHSGLGSSKTDRRPKVTPRMPPDAECRASVTSRNPPRASPGSPRP
jgi:hypothetical protein